MSNYCVYYDYGNLSMELLELSAYTYFNEFLERFVVPLGENFDILFESS